MPAVFQPIMDAIAEIWFGGNFPRCYGGRLAKCQRDFRDLNPGMKDIEIVPEIHARAQRYRDRWPEISCTPEALVKHWFTFSAPVKTAAQLRKENEDRYFEEQRKARLEKEKEWKRGMAG